MRKIVLVFLLFLCSIPAYADDIWIFSTSWCKPCKDLKSLLKTYHKTLEQQGHRLTFIDIDNDPELKREYNIDSVPTTIVFSDTNKEKGRMEGYSKTVWQSWIKNTVK